MLDISKSDRLGPNLRTLRVERGLTLDRLATMSELTRGYLSLVERGLKTPSIAALLRLAAALDVHVAQLFDLNAISSPRYTLQRATDVAPGEGGAAGLVPLAAGRARKAMEPFLIRPPMAGDTKARPIHWAHHGGEEMVFVVSGSITVKLGSEELLLETGDCLYFSGEERHDLRSVGDRQAQVLVVIAVSAPEDADTAPHTEA
ncbi:cupin domain-containing protein [Xanthobacter sp. KR7-65]|uniref:helix-turn-helix domain-containing protein n=1 Tax=Xanthobacter sp. KR7-65 TaxID=3156612 RepID=UPI0032B41BED